MGLLYDERSNDARSENTKTEISESKRPLSKEELLQKEFDDLFRDDSEIGINQQRTYTPSTDYKNKATTEQIISPVIETNKLSLAEEIEILKPFLFDDTEDDLDLNDSKIINQQGKIRNIGDRFNDPRRSYNYLYKNFDKEHIPAVLDDEININTNDTIGLEKELFNRNDLPTTEYNKFILDMKMVEELFHKEEKKINEYFKDETKWNAYTENLLNSNVYDINEFFAKRNSISKCITLSELRNDSNIERLQDSEDRLSDFLDLNVSIIKLINSRYPYMAFLNETLFDKI